MYLHVPTNRLHVSTISLHFLLLVKTTRLDPYLVKTTCLAQTTCLDHYTSQSFLGKNYTSRSLFGKNYTSRSFFGKNYTSGSQSNSTQWTILITSVSHNSLKSSPISMILIYSHGLVLGTPPLHGTGRISRFHNSKCSNFLSWIHQYYCSQSSQKAS